MSFTLTAMTIEHYDAVLALWQASAGVGLRLADEKEHIARYLRRNPGLSFVAHRNGRLVGAVLCGHDGRRGYIHHLAVAAPHRRQGIGRALVEQALAGLSVIGIQKCHLFVFQDNDEAIAFWQKIGWFERNELLVMSRLDGDANA
ncbi:MAG TPA: GNAT family N-acetyltransferase [Caldilineae bacterium]|nr:GNAT family N-acetyltransferase [Caldilineae bacterium]